MFKFYFILVSFLLLLSCSKINRKGKEYTYSKQGLVSSKKNFKHRSIYPEKKFERIELYPYDTLLSGGYYLSYCVYTDSIYQNKIQQLSLKKNQKTISVLSETSYGLLFKNLGYTKADFGKTFVFVQSFGSGNPHEITLIKKSNGEELLKGCWVDADEREQILLYIKDIHQKNEALILFDIKNEKETIINDFKTSICATKYAEGIRDCVKIDTITLETIVLIIENQDEKIVRTYPR